MIILVDDKLSSHFPWRLAEDVIIDCIWGRERRYLYLRVIINSVLSSDLMMELVDFVYVELWSCLQFVISPLVSQVLSHCPCLILNHGEEAGPVWLDGWWNRACPSGGSERLQSSKKRGRTTEVSCLRCLTVCTEVCVCHWLWVQMSLCLVHTHLYLKERLN